MWKCPKCNKSFENKNQHHFCEHSSLTIDDYINEQSEGVKLILQQVRTCIKQAIPEATERMSWQMPTFWHKHNLIHFAAFKKHLGIYPGDEAISFFADKLNEYQTSKGAIRFYYNEEIPYDLIAEIALWCYQSGNHH
ncbi:MAG: DUF1801 domain-containing protein [Erysipelotrichaceae bacterium]|nr:DUF1801 domain-containing protein [Erysipelotrichaceae bacterium]